MSFHWFWPLIRFDSREDRSSQPLEEEDAGAFTQQPETAHGPRDFQLNPCHWLSVAQSFCQVHALILCPPGSAPFILQMLHSTKSTSFLCSFYESLFRFKCVFDRSQTPLFLMPQMSDLEKRPQVTPQTHLFMSHAKAQSMDRSGAF